MAKVLIVRMSSFGDVAMLVPVVYSVAARYPQDRFTVMTRKAFAPLFEHLGFNVNVMSIDLSGRHRGIFGIFRMIKRTLGSGFSHVADEHDVLRSKIIRTLLFITGTKVAYLDKAREEKRKAIETKQLDPPLRSVTLRYQDVFDKLGFPAEMVFSNLFDFVKRDFSRLKAVVSEKKGTWIGIAPFAKHRGKIYPLEKMEEVVKTLSGEDGNTILLLGSGKEEAKVLQSWAKKYPNVIDTSGKLNIERELLLISYMDVVLSMDSANMHLASLVQVPVVSVWGATHPGMGFYDFNQDINNAVQGETTCRPCSVYGETPCARGEYLCMNSISETRIVDKIHEVLRNKSV